MNVGLTVGQFLGFGFRDERGSQHEQSNLFRHAVVNIISRSSGKDDGNGNDTKQYNWLNEEK